MSRKITSFLMLLIALFVSNSVKAQDDIDFAGKTVTIGTVVDNFEPNTWYFLHQGRDVGIGTGQYAPALAGEIPMSGGFLYDQGIGKDILKPGIGNVEDESIATGKAGFLVRFVPTENEGAYKIQFGTGNWLTEPSSRSNSAKFTSTDNFYDAGEFNLYYIDSETAPGAIGFNLYDMDVCVDNNFGSASGISTSNTVVAWGSGKHESVLNEEGMIVSNSIWSVVEIEWGEVEMMTAAAEELQATYDEYYPYLEGFQANIGTDPGQYSEEAVSNFENILQAAYDAADEVMGPDGENTQYTVESLNALKQAIIDAYEAVLASKVPMALADGYYRIKSGMKYYTTENVVNEETGEEEAVTIYHDKYMYSAKSGSSIKGFWGTPDDLSTDCPSLWKITGKEGGVFDIQNVATEARFNNIAQSTEITMSPESENLIAIDVAGVFNDTTYYNLRVSTQAANAYLYIHQNNHSNGAGAGSTLVGWCRTFDEASGAKASEWYFVPVPEEEVQQIMAAWEVINNHDQMVASYKEMVSDAKTKIEIAKDISVALDEESPIVTDVSQFSSPYTEPNEGSIDALIDGDVNTFWHSAWSSGAVPGGTHYLQVEMMNPSLTNVAFKYIRRNVVNDHITEWSIYGTNDGEANKADCELLATLSTPWTANDETIISSVFPTKGYSYLRFYCDNTVGSSISSTRGYFHMAEFQLYPAEIIQSITCQYNMLGDVVKNLENLIEEQKEIADADLTLDDYNKLKEVYDAFLAKFVDPAELRQTLANVESAGAGVTIGTQPGFWSDNSTVATLNNTIEAATAYDAAGIYTQEQSDIYVADLKAQADAITAAAISIKEGKWYAIRFPSEEMFEEHEWDKVAGEGVYNAEKDIWTAPNLWNKYAAVTEQVTEETGNVEMEESEPDQVALGHQLHFIYDEGITEFANKDLALFRFINVGDSAYILQNKATNLFLKSAPTGAVILSAHPSLYSQRAIGYGLNVIAAKSIIGENQNYLHAQVGGNLLVNWNVDYPGSRSGLFIEEIEDVASDYEGVDFNVALNPGEVHTFCFPVEISAGDNIKFWGLNSIEGTKVTLAKIESPVAGGRPFIAVADGEYDAEDEQAMFVMKHGYDITATEASASNPLKGTFGGEKVGAGVLVAEGNTLAVSKKSSTAIGANEAWIATEEKFDLEADIEVVWDTEAADGLQTALQNVSRSGNVYTVDGRLVGRNATLNDLSRYGKGVYILNGTKVIVK